MSGVVALKSPSRIILPCAGVDDAGNEETVNAVVGDAGNEETVDAVVDDARNEETVDAPRQSYGIKTHPRTIVDDAADAADVDVTVDVDLVCVTITRNKCATLMETST